ncbi:hypothetical protein OF83DRAFT_491797 [Amylostereum chailletii]|nr:hypothetical protein OF83DRAFT_491797 [Amylostereum chailletii]
MPPKKKSKGRSRGGGGGGGGSSSSQAAGTARYAPPDDVLDNVFKAEGWDAIVTTLCKLMDLPELSTRHGLKTMHRDFESINLKLEELYAFAWRTQNDRIAGAVVGIYAKASADAKLRDRIFLQAGFLAKVLPLLTRPDCCHVALQALSSVTHHSGMTVRLQIAREASVLLQFLEDHPDDMVAAELAWAVISHSGAAVVNNDQPPDPIRRHALQMPRLIRLALVWIRKKSATGMLKDHVLTFLSGATQHCSDDFFANPSAVHFLLACCRNKDIRTRSEGVGAILRLNIARGRVEETGQDPLKLVAAVQRGWPPHLSELLVDYGMMRTDTFLVMSTARDFQQAMMGVLGDHDLAGLGMKLATYILRTEYSITQGGWQVEDERTGERKLGFGLLYRAAEHSASLALSKLQEAASSGQELDEGYAFAMCAWEDTKTFIEEAPPDTRSMLSVMYLHTLMSVVLKGHDQAPELPQLRNVRNRMGLVEDIMNFLSRPISQTQMRLASMMYLEQLPAAWKEWDIVVKNYTQTPSNEVDKHKAEDNLTEWLSKVELEDTDMSGRSSAHHHTHHPHPSINMNEVHLYRCSWCGNPSAMLKRCRGCQRARYCDEACQKEHWSGSHRKTCAKAAAETS